jgi:hypothetical protein
LFLIAYAQLHICIIEIDPVGHYPLVESIARIYSTQAGNKITVYTIPRGLKALNNILQDNIEVREADFSNGYSTFFYGIRNFDKIFITTLEPNSRLVYILLKAFLNTKFECPIYFFVHHIDFWFKQGLIDKLRNILFRFEGIRNFLYKIKVQFLYAPILKKVSQKILNSQGKLVVLSENLKQALATFVPLNKIAVIPFSVYDPLIVDESNQGDKFRICIPGFLCSRRRNYASILQLMDNNEFFIKKICWDFLGGNPDTKDSQNLIAQFQTMQKKGHDIHYYSEKLLDMKYFDSQLAKADIILGNMQLQTNANTVYGKTNETGVVFSMIKCAKPGLLPHFYSFDKSLDTSVIRFNKYDEIPNILYNLISQKDSFLQLKKNALSNSVMYSCESVYTSLESQE